MKRENPPITIEGVRETYRQRKNEIRDRLEEFAGIWKMRSNSRLWEEMVFCFFTGGCSAKMGLRSVEAVRGLLEDGDHEQLMNALVGTHRYPRARARYIVESRNFLQSDCGMDLRARLSGFSDHDARRDWLVKEKRIKGLGYKEASHFLRNIGFNGYGILDKHVLKCLSELNLIDDPKPPGTRFKYLTIENQLKELANLAGIGFDELDLVLWSMKTGEILK